MVVGFRVFWVYDSLDSAMLSVFNFVPMVTLRLVRLVLWLFLELLILVLVINVVSWAVDGAAGLAILLGIGNSDTSTKYLLPAIVTVFATVLLLPRAFPLLGDVTNALQRAPLPVGLAVWAVAGIAFVAGVGMEFETYLDRGIRQVDPIVNHVARVLDRPELLEEWEADVAWERQRRAGGTDTSQEERTSRRDQSRTASEEPPAAPSPAEPPAEVEVAGASQLNLRADPSLDAPVLEVLSGGARYAVTARSAVRDDITWLELELPDGRRGWASSRYLRPVP